MNMLIHIVHHIDLEDIYMLMLLFLMNHIQHVLMNMYRTDIDKQMYHFQEMKGNHHVNKHPMNDMGRLFLR
jgi:hypothetical protein